MISRSPLSSHTLLFSLVSVLSFTVSCSPSKAPSQPEADSPVSTVVTQPQAQASAQASSSVQSSSSQVEGDTYVVTLPSSQAKSTGQVTVKPLPGYKINAEFPHRLKYRMGDKVLTATVDQDPKHLSFALKDAALPETGVKAEASFSVCNDSSCQMYQKTYQW